MHINYLPVNILFDKLCFYDKYKDNEEIVDELQEYLREMHSRVYSWYKFCDDEKAHVASSKHCEYEKDFKRLRDIDKLVIEKQCLKKILSVCEKIIQTKQIVTGTLCIYERHDNIAIKRIELQVTGRYLHDKVEGIFEIIELNDEMIVLQKTINKHIHEIKNQLIMMLATANNIQKSTQKSTVKNMPISLKILFTAVTICFLP